MKLLICADSNSLHTFRWASMAHQAGISVAVFSLNPLTLKEWERLLPHVKIYHAHTGIQQNVMQGETSFSKLKYLGAVKTLKQTISIFQPDILHAHYATSYGLISVLSGFKNIAISVWGSDIFDFPKKSFLHTGLMKKILSKAKVIHSTGEIMATEARKYTNTHVEVIPFGIDINKYKPKTETKTWHKIQTEPIIGAVKSMERIYGIDVLIHAFALLQKQIPAARLVLTGGGSKLENYKQLVSNLRIEKHVTFTGKMSPSDIPRQLQSFDIFCNLSRRESFGMSILEASACGIPVIATHVDGVVETAQNHVNAITVDVENAQAAADAILRMLHDEKLYYSLKAGGINLIQNHFDQLKITDKISEFYQRIS